MFKSNYSVFKILYTVQSTWQLIWTLLLFQLKDIAEKGKVNPTKVPKLEDKTFDKKILTMVNKIEEIDIKTEERK